MANYEDDYESSHQGSTIDRAVSWANTHRNSNPTTTQSNLTQTMSNLASEISRAQAAEAELLKRLQGTSTNTDARTDPFKMVKTYDYDTYGDWNGCWSAFNQDLDNLDLYTPKDNGWLVYNVSGVIVRVLHVFYNFASHKVVDFVLGPVKLSANKVACADSTADAQIMTRKCDGTGYGEWSIYGGDEVTNRNAKMRYGGYSFGAITEPTTKTFKSIYIRRNETIGICSESSSSLHVKITYGSIVVEKTITSSARNHTDLWKYSDSGRLDQQNDLKVELSGTGTGVRIVIV